MLVLLRRLFICSSTLFLSEAVDLSKPNQALPFLASCKYEAIDSEKQNLV